MYVLTWSVEYVLVVMGMGEEGMIDCIALRARSDILLLIAVSCIECMAD